MANTRARGFTLLELLVGIAVTSIILLAVAASFIAAQASYQSDAEIKTAAEGGRSSVAFLEHAVGMAGYGLEPAEAFDFGAPPGMAGKDNVAVATGVVTDDLAFRYREPSYLRRGSLAGTTLQLEAGNTFGADLSTGQMMIVACETGGLYAAVRLAAAVADADDTVNVNIEGAPFPSTVPPCTGNTGANAPYVMLVNEFRVRVVNLGGRPWLVAFRNLTDNVTVLDNSVPFDPIAADVEDFQVSYLMNRPPPSSGCCAATAAVDAAGNGNWIMGDVAADPLPNPSLAAPTSEDSYDTGVRYTASPANIRAVRLSLGLRSSRPEPTKRKAFAPVSLENHAPGGVADGYYRTSVTTAVPVPNMLSRTFFAPPIRAATDTNDLNYNGG